MNDRYQILQTMRRMKQAYKSGMKKLDYLPLRLWVELTNHCNLKCSFCVNSRPGAMQKGYMTLDTFKEVVKQARWFAYDMNLSHRGESLLHKDLPAMIAYAKENNIATRLNTNATLLSNAISDALIGAGLDFISFSFEGLDPEAYERARVSASYETTLSNILDFLRLKRKRGSVSPYVMLEVLDIPTVDTSRANVREFKSLFKGLPLNKLTIKPLHNWGGQLDDPQVTAKGGDAFPGRLRYSPCTNIWYSMVVLWDGSVALCSQDWHNDNCLGHMGDSSLEAMWNGEVIVEVRELLAKKEFRQIEVCSGCDLLWRPSVGGVPNVNLVSYLSENILGYSRLRGLLSPIEKFIEGRGGISSRRIVR
jgi:radical SAM protein with 4Fe4S-binding SPASM domain